MIRFKSTCSDAHLAIAFFHFAHLLDAGLSVDEALADVQVLETQRSMRKVWFEVVIDVRNGKNLSAALRRWPNVFNASILSIVSAGEAAGKLADAIHEVESLLKWQAELRNRLAAALAYPIFAVLVLLLVVLFLFTSVVPSLADYLVLDEAALISWHTKSALVLSRSLVGLTWQGGLAFGLVVGLSVLIVFATRRGRRIYDALILHIPVVGEMLIALWVSRYCQLVGKLYAAGVPLIDAMTHGEYSIANQILHAHYVKARHAVSQGATLIKAFENDPLIPVLFRRLIAVGESSGSLDVALLRCSNQLYRYTNHRIERIERLMGPVMLCVVGFLLLWIVVSVLSPVYQRAIEVVVQ